MKKPTATESAEPASATESAASDQDAVKGIVTPVVRGMRLLRYIAEGGNTANLSEVGRSIDVNRVTVMRLLATLEHEGLIEALPQGGHRVGLGLLGLAASALGTFDPLDAGRRAAAQLSQDLGVSAYMVVLEGHHVVYVHREMPEGGLVSHIRVGSRVPAFLTAPGRAMLAMLPDSRVQALQGAWRMDPSAHALQADARPFDPGRFARQLEEIRSRGCAWSFSGYEEGVNACAAAIKGPRGVPAAALSLVAAQPLFDADPSLQERMQQGVLHMARSLSRVAGN